MPVQVVENKNELVAELGLLIQYVAQEAIEENGIFKVGLSGGSLIDFLASALPHINSKFDKWKLFFCDERVVPVDDTESTFGVYKNHFVGKLFKEEQFVQIKQGVSADVAAKDYIQQMEKYFPTNYLPKFDLLLLGMGPDGHTCSLFPGHKLLGETSTWVAPIFDSPKPPPCRITLTFPVINNASSIIFAMAGEGKADMVKKILIDKVDLPATRVKPTHGKIYWILDKTAAKYL